ncbi:MAG: Crp/Fnr family transcriptional regulator [bacterium]|nr:MAG: Crp/Fnr family transcriptional regulator [bacterium]
MDWSLEKKTHALERFNIFSGLDRDFLTELASIARPVEIRKKDLVFREGDPARGFYLLVRGRIKLSKISAGGKEQVLHFVKEGDSFAEAALYMDRTYPAFAEALEDSQLLLVPCDIFLDKLKGDPDLAANLIAHLAQLLHLLTRKVEELSLMDASSRLCRYILSNLDRDTGSVKLSMGKGHTASSLGMAVETFSRTLSKLKEDGVVRETSPGVLQVMDMEALEKFCE